MNKDAVPLRDNPRYAQRAEEFSPRVGGIPEMTFIVIPEAEICCGSASIDNLVQPEPAEERGRRTVEDILSTLIDAAIRGLDPIAAAHPNRLDSPLDSPSLTA